jgi:hypothetical protein
VVLLPFLALSAEGLPGVTPTRLFVRCAVILSVMDASANTLASLSRTRVRPREAWHEQAATEGSTNTHLDLPTLWTRAYPGYTEAIGF